jgi:hypothetical protein
MDKVGEESGLAVVRLRIRPLSSSGPALREKNEWLTVTKELKLKKNLEETLLQEIKQEKICYITLPVKNIRKEINK